ncbi:MAG: HEAT repeat domain-containing protein [Planctomycetota bacterium]
MLGLVKEAASGARSTAPVIALMDALLGWSSDVALEVVKARAPSSVKLQIVQQLAGRGAKAELILVALLGDDYPRVREQVVVALGRVRSKETRELLMRRLVVERDW